MLSNASLISFAIAAAIFPVYGEGDEVQPQPHAHAHNDYEHERPLFDALEHGFCSVEADVFAIEGELRIGHFRFQTRPGRTLETLYFKPLQERIKANGGRVFRDGPPFFLLIDFKTDGAETYRLLRPMLQKYRSMFESPDDRPPAVSVVISGNRPFELIQNDQGRLCGIDGRLSDLNSQMSADLLPLISDNWRKHFRWTGTGDMPETERKKLHEIVEKAHRAGRRVRFWATPESEAVWRELRAAGVDHLNTDQLARLQTFLKKTFPREN